MNQATNKASFPHSVASKKGVHTFINLLTQRRHLALGNPRHPQRLNQIIDLSGRYHQSKLPGSPQSTLSLTAAAAQESSENRCLEVT